MNDTIKTKNTIGNCDALTVQNVRVLYPWELKKLISVIPKREQRTNFEALLYSGMRYVEAVRLLEKPEMYMRERGKIHLDSYAIRKKKIKIKERFVILNPIGRRVIEAFIEQKYPLPSYNVWTENLIRWAGYAGLQTYRLSPKTTRKTLECYLVAKYPLMTNVIFSSQGHNDLTALKFYVTLPFSEQDKKEMEEFVYGWEP